MPSTAVSAPDTVRRLERRGDADGLGGHGQPPPPPRGAAPGGRLPDGAYAGPRPTSDDSARKNMLLLVQLRWIAVIGQIATIVGVQVALDIALPLAAMSIVIAALVVLNLSSVAWLRRRRSVTNRGLFLALVLDVGALSAQLYLSGGATNPFTSLYLLQVTLGAVLLGGAATWALVALTATAFTALTLFYIPLVLPQHGGGDLFSLHLIGALIGFALNAALIATFVTRVSRNLREGDAGLAAMRQHAAEEDHIVRMGLLASGAAHELGTPLSSLSVILGDWRRMPDLSTQPDIAGEIEEMQAAVERCKAIVTGILLAAGAARGDAPHVTTVKAFMDDLVREWRDMRSADELSYRDEFGEDLSIVSDTALKQVVFNVLDNAFDMSPDQVAVVLSRDKDALHIAISDAGPGFAPDMLSNLGKPYRSSKGRLGGGLGLFLVVNVVRKLGGAVAARNLPEGGATVTLTLPLATLAV